jgi:RNA polymerase sigma-70 factor (ECF subfamily)
VNERLPAAARLQQITQATADEELVRQAASGQPDAFDELVARYQDRVFNVLTRMTGSTQDAEDLAQETFLKAYRALNSFRQGSKFYTWLFRIAVNTGFSRRRQEGRRKAHEGARLEGTKDGGEDSEQWSLENAAVDRTDSDPVAQLEKEQLRARVREGLKEIDADYRTILILRDIDGIDYDGIAETLEISTAAVKSRLHRARLEMARILKDLKQ